MLHLQQCEATNVAVFIGTHQGSIAMRGDPIYTIVAAFTSVGSEATNQSDYVNLETLLAILILVSPICCMSNAVVAGYFLTLKEGGDVICSY